MTDNATLNIGDICLYYFNDGNKSLSLVEVVKDYSEEVAVVGFHQVFVDDSGNGLFEYLCKKGKIMMVSKEFLHKVDLANRQRKEIDDLTRNDLPRCKDALRRANEIGMGLDKENQELKAEIEKLKADVNRLTSENENLTTARTEAIEDVLLTLEAEANSSDKYIREYDDSDIQKAYNKGLWVACNLVKEMTGENHGE